MYGRQVVAAPAPVVWNHRVPANHWSRLRRSALIRHTIRRHINHPQDLMWTCWVIPLPWMDIPQDRLFSNSTILTEAWGHLLDLSVYPVANRKCFSQPSMNSLHCYIDTLILGDKSPAFPGKECPEKCTDIRKTRMQKDNLMKFNVKRRNTFFHVYLVPN